ncbi:hypothetical protein PHLCEN_2v7014 [Hermanssonia centrifuga]|uniref:Uncharacterized protein n=1 Tax=Hermanssonia centrifuga TaxID=98765 RepID=A0A2R6NXV4_9APHY|nr:hypothetical protein PHLCEN_2v7014 [Hermanssonia centrifuga]
MSTEKPSGTLPSSNWMALQKKLKPKRSTPDSAYARKKRKIQHEASSSDIPSQPIASTSFPRGPQQYETQTSVPALPAQPLKNGDSLSSLRAMVAGQVEYNAAQKL